MEKNVLSRLEIELTLDNIIRKKERFVLDVKDNFENLRWRINKKKDIITVYDHHTDKKASFKFEKFILSEFGGLQNTKKNIKDVYVNIPTHQERVIFISYISTTIKSICENQKQLFIDFPYLKKVIHEIVDFCNTTYNFKLEYPFKELISEQHKYKQPFIVESKFNNESIEVDPFINLFKLFIKNNILANNLLQKDFIDIFKGFETNKIIKFRVDTPSAVMILESIEYIYKSFKPVDIGRSKRFYTSTDKLLTASNFSSAKARQGKEYLHSVNDTIQNITKIFPVEL